MFPIAVALLALVSLGMVVLTLRYAARVLIVSAPNGREYEVAMNRDGVRVFRPPSAFLNRGTPFAAAFGFLNRRRRRLRGWAVYVRPNPSAGYQPLLHEVFDTERAAAQRLPEVADLIRAGQTSWPEEAEWYR